MQPSEPKHAISHSPSSTRTVPHPGASAKNPRLNLQAFFPQMRHPQSRSPSTALFQYTDQLMSNPTSYSIISTEMIALQRRGL